MLDIEHVGHIRRVQLDGESRREVDAEVVMRNQQHASGGNDLHQYLADHFCIGIGKRLVRDLPDLVVAGFERVADRIELAAESGDDRNGRCSGVNLLGRGDQFQRGIVGNSGFVRDVSEYAAHACNPPLLFINSISLPITSSRSPVSISAPWPSAGTK